VFGFDKYAPYLIAAYLIAGAALCGIVIWSVLRHQRAVRTLAGAEKEDSK